MANIIPERTGVVRDEKTGELILPATQRPDGTWRKPRRVKDGYIPQDEMPAYETKGTQWAKSKPDYPIGLSPDDIEKMKSAKSGNEEPEETKTAMSKSAKKNAKRKEKRKQLGGPAASERVVDSAATSLFNVKLSAGKDAPPATITTSDTNLSREEIEKKIKGLKKKLRQIEDLETKINLGELKNPEKEQLEKIERKKQIVEAIEDLELDLDD